MSIHTEQIYTDLKDQIIRGVFPPAFSLTETDLAQKYGVSRNTIKKSLMMLESEGLVSIERNKGAKVRVYSIEEVLEFLEVRDVLEGYVARITAAAISDTQIAEMEGLLEQMKQLSRDKDLLAYSQCNHQLHQIIYDACPNHTAANMTVLLKQQMRKYNSKTILIPGRDMASLREHEKILEAMKAHDGDAAEESMREHIRNVSNTFRENYMLLF